MKVLAVNYNQASFLIEKTLINTVKGFDRHKISFNEVVFLNGESRTLEDIKKLKKYIPEKTVINCYCSEVTWKHILRTWDEALMYLNWKKIEDYKSIDDKIFIPIWENRNSVYDYYNLVTKDYSFLTPVSVENDKLKEYIENTNIVVNPLYIDNIKYKDSDSLKNIVSYIDDVDTKKFLLVGRYKHRNLINKKTLEYYYDFLKNKEDNSFFINRRYTMHKFRFFVETIKKADDDKRLVVGIASTDDLDRDNEVVSTEALKDAVEILKERKVPLYLEHKHSSSPIGRVVEGKYENGKLLIKAYISETAQKEWTLVKEGILAYFSIGGKILDTEDITLNGRTVTRITKFDLYEVSLTGIPANPKAEVLSFSKAIKKALDVKGAVDYKPEVKVDEDKEWDADSAEERVRKWASSDNSGDKDTIDWKKYRRAFAWYDEEDAENFGSYKLPHHDIVDDKLTTIWRGVAASFAALQGARGGVDIPEEDVDRVESHIAKHYEQFDREVQKAIKEELLELIEEEVVDKLDKNVEKQEEKLFEYECVECSKITEKSEEVEDLKCSDCEGEMKLKEADVEDEKSVEEESEEDNKNEEDTDEKSEEADIGKQEDEEEDIEEPAETKPTIFISSEDVADIAPFEVGDEISLNIDGEVVSLSEDEESKWLTIEMDAVAVTAKHIKEEDAKSEEEIDEKTEEASEEKSLEDRIKELEEVVASFTKSEETEEESEDEEVEKSEEEIDEKEVEDKDLTKSDRKGLESSELPADNPLMRLKGKSPKDIMEDEELFDSLDDESKELIKEAYYKDFLTK